MLRLTIFLALSWSCMGLDLNGNMMKKYAFMKIMSGCLGEDFVMMIKQEMMKACAECHARDMNVTHQPNFDYLINHFRNSQQSIPMTLPTQQNPLHMYQPFVYPVFMQSPYSVPSFPQYQAQRHNPQQYNTFPHHHAADVNAFPHSYAQYDQNVHYQLPSIHQHNVPNIPVEHYTSAVPQYNVNNLQNLYGLTNEHHLNSKFNEHKHENIGNLNIQGHPFTNNDVQDTLLPNLQLRSPIPNNQLGYPQNEHHERQFFDLNPQYGYPQQEHHEKQFYELNPQPVSPQRRKKRSLPTAPENLDTLKRTLTSKLGNMTCVFREMGWLTEENEVNFTFIEQQIKNLNLNMKLQDDLVYSHDICKDISMCMPTEKAKHPLMREMGGAMSYMKCMSLKAVTACMKNDFRMYQAKMGLGASDNGLPMEIDNLLKNQHSDPSQLADDIGSLMFTDAAEMPL